MALNTSTFALAAAHGITPRVIATWHADLPRTPRVLVPVQLDALGHCGGTGGEVMLRARPDRWLVIRVGPSVRGAARRGIRGWVLRTADPKPVPIDLDEWKEMGNLPEDAGTPPTE